MRFSLALSAIALVAISACSDDDNNTTAPPITRTFDQIEREVLKWALHQQGGSRRRAARSLAMPRSTLCDKVRRYGLG